MNLKTHYNTLAEIGVFVLLLSVAIAPKLAYLSHCFWMDEARELWIARNFVMTGEFNYLSEPWRQHPFGFYLMLAPVYSATQAAHEIFYTLEILVLSAFSAYFVYVIGKTLYSRTAGFVAGVLFAFSPVYAFYSLRILNDIPVIFFMTAAAAVYCLAWKRGAKRYYVLAGLLIGGAMLIKLIGVLVGLSIFVHILYRFWSEPDKRGELDNGLALVITCALAVFSTWLVYNMFTIGTFFPFDVFAGRLVGAEAGVDVGNWTYYFVYFVPLVRLSFAVAAVFGLLVLYLKRFENFSFLAVWFTVVFLFMSFFWSVKVERYILPLFPVVMLVIGVGFDKVARDLGRVGKLIVAIVVVLMCVMSLSDLSSLWSYSSTTFCGFGQVAMFLDGLPQGRIVAGSIAQVAWLLNTQNIMSPPRELADFEAAVQNNEYAYVLIDIWERTQPDYLIYWANNDPYWAQAKRTFYLDRNETQVFAVLYSVRYFWNTTNNDNAS